MKKSTISIDVFLDQNKVPESISWTASDSSIEKAQIAKAMMLAFWDNTDKTALKIDLWTKDMMVDEMADFYFQTYMSMADSFERATSQKELVDEMKEFAKGFLDKFKEIQMKENKA